MKKLAVTDQSACMACLQCVNACSEAFYKVASTDLSCIQITEKKGAIKTDVCIQCGKCARACASEAITQNAKGVYMINKKKCVGCGECVKACPFGLVVMPAETKIASKCIACGICAKQCPMEILYIKES